MFFKKRQPQQELKFPDPAPVKFFKWVVALIVVGLTVVLFSSVVRAQPGALASLNDAESGQLVFQSDGGAFQQAVHLGTKVDVEINGLIAKVCLLYTSPSPRDS